MPDNKLDPVQILLNKQDLLFKKFEKFEEEYKTIPWRVKLMETVIFGGIKLILVAFLVSLLILTGLKVGKVDNAAACIKKPFEIILEDTNKIIEKQK
jgi:hypothetical protein